MRPTQQYPDRLVRSVGEPLVAAAREQPKDVRAGQVQVDDLAAVLAGQPAPSRLASVRVRRGRVTQPDTLTLTQAATAVMGYLDPAPGSELEDALKAMRTTLLTYVAPGTRPLGNHSAPTGHYST